MTNNKQEVYGFRFLDTLNQSFYQLFAVGNQIISKESYHWNGLTRKDGPLFLFQYTLAGCGYIEVDETLHKLGKGTGFMVEIPSNHRYFFLESNTDWEVLFIMFRPTNIEEEWRHAVSSLGQVFSMPEDSSPIRLLKSVFASAAKNHITDGFRASAIVYEFVMELFRNHVSAKKEKHSWPDPIAEAASYIEETYQSLQSLEEIAAKVNLSKYYFTRLYKKTTGYTPIEYLTKVRMEEAIRLLRDSDMTMEAIAQELGYSTGSYFIKVFHQWIGISPGEFRLATEHAYLHKLKLD
ncbi:AraC family transcriptional regulator [Niallia taxi]|uniref:helix-turn-helix transcriptional regulator n=1 Tax=Niallia taxi TaxID=2499688 RepID=UPI002934113D|nr:AraC family transcriptional regulator [Niallia taxi]WOD62448.1 AraC family transcriptional regulator [Niallia taxi]